MTISTRHDATERAYEAIRRRILDGTYTPGSRLGEADVAGSLAISRTPVRSALVRLGVEGLVELIPARGAFVAKWTRDDVEEIFGLRIALEPLVAALAAEKIGDEEIAALEALADEMETELARGAADRSYVDATTELNARFHRMLMDAARNHHLRAMLSAAIELPLMHRTIAELGPDRLANAWAEHRELIAAMAAHDAELAASVMLTHLLAARDAIRRMIAREDPAAMPAAA